MLCATGHHDGYATAGRNATMMMMADDAVDRRNRST